MNSYRYDRKALYWDVARGAIGLGISVMFLSAAPTVITVLVIFGGLALVFGVYLLRTYLRILSTIEVDANGIRVNAPLSKAISWSDLDGLKLRFFATSRSRKNTGWMEMTLTSGGTKISIESSLEGFNDVARHCRLVAESNGVELSETTRENLDGLEHLKEPSEQMRPHLESGLRDRWK